MLTQRLAKTDDRARRPSHRAGPIEDGVRFCCCCCVFTLHLAQGTTAQPAELFFWTILFYKMAFRLNYYLSEFKNQISFTIATSFFFLASPENWSVWGAHLRLDLSGAAPADGARTPQFSQPRQACRPLSDLTCSLPPPPPHPHTPRTEAAADICPWGQPCAGASGHSAWSSRARCGEPTSVTVASEPGGWTLEPPDEAPQRWAVCGPGARQGCR